jgi:peptidoglycan/LPS O-acetylase OafA/YrhL
MTYQQISTNKRVLYFDQIRALMIALVIAVHVFPLAFTSGWIGVRIPTAGSADGLFGVAGGFFLYYCNSFFMCMLFLLSGYFVPRSVHKKGIACYLKARLLRIGIPFLVGLLFINNASVLLGRLSPASPYAELSWNALPFNSVMALWFLVVLFVFDLLYCAWVGLRGDRFSVDTSVPAPQLRSWIISAVVLATLEVVMVKQTDLWIALARSPLNGLGAQGMHIFTYAFLFFLGCKASFHRWLERLNTHLVVRWFRFSVALALCVLAIALVLTFNGSMSSESGKLSLLGTLLSPFIGWGMIAYLLLWFQRNENQCGQWLATAGVDSFGAYVIHPLVLVIVLTAIGFIGFNHWLIALTASVLGIMISFGISHQLRRIPSVARII